MNHVGFVINMTGQHLPNYYQHYEIAYANLLWGRDGEEEVWEDICQDIEEVRQQGECVVLHGADNIEGPACLGSLYLMNKYRFNNKSQIPMVPLQNLRVHASQNR